MPQKCSLKAFVFNIHHYMVEMTSEDSDNDQCLKEAFLCHTAGIPTYARFAIDSELISRLTSTGKTAHIILTELSTSSITY